MSGFIQRNINGVLQSAISSIAKFLHGRGLDLSPAMTATMFFPGKNRRRHPLTLSVGASVIKRVCTHCFLGVVLGSTFQWHVQVNNLIK